MKVTNLAMKRFLKEAISTDYNFLVPTYDIVQIFLFQSMDCLDFDNFKYFHSS